MRFSSVLPAFIVLAACAAVAPTPPNSQVRATHLTELLDLPLVSHATVPESCEPLEYSPDYESIACVETDAQHALDVFGEYAHAIESAGWTYTDHHGFAISYERLIHGSSTCVRSLHFVGTPENFEQYMASVLEPSEDNPGKMIFRFLVRREPVCGDESQAP